MAEMNGVFAVNKPTNISSAQFLSKIQRIFTSSKVFSAELSSLQGKRIQQIQKEGGNVSRRKLRNVLKVKMGHGGTLDPLASGILVIGVGQGTKKLQSYLNGSVKTYETEALFGGSTTTGDVEGELLTRTTTSNLTQDMIDEIPSKFKGELKQTPPIFAALKMNGKPLYEYAREGIPLPKAIKPRIIQIYELEVFDDTLRKDHDYQMKQFSKDVEGLEESLFNNQTLNNDKLYYSKEYCESKGISIEEAVHPKPGPIEPYEKEIDFKAPLLHFKAKVGSGTYIRSLISDIGKSCGSSAYMVKLIRSQQAEWELGRNVFELSDFEDRDDSVWGKALQEVLEKGGENIQSLSQVLSDFEDEVKRSNQQEIEFNERIQNEIDDELKESEKERLIETEPNAEAETKIETETETEISKEITSQISDKKRKLEE